MPDVSSDRAGQEYSSAPSSLVDRHKPLPPVPRGGVDMPPMQRDAPQDRVPLLGERRQPLVSRASFMNLRGLMGKNKSSSNLKISSPTDVRKTPLEFETADIRMLRAARDNIDPSHEIDPFLTASPTAPNLTLASQFMGSTSNLSTHSQSGKTVTFGSDISPGQTSSNRNVSQSHTRSPLGVMHDTEHAEDGYKSRFDRLKSSIANRLPAPFSNRRARRHTLSTHLSRVDLTAPALVSAETEQTSRGPLGPAERGNLGSPKVHNLMLGAESRSSPTTDSNTLPIHGQMSATDRPSVARGTGLRRSYRQLLRRRGVSDNLRGGHRRDGEQAELPAASGAGHLTAKDRGGLNIDFGASREALEDKHGLATPSDTMSADLANQSAATSASTYPRQPAEPLYTIARGNTFRRTPNSHPKYPPKSISYLNSNPTPYLDALRLTDPEAVARIDEQIAQDSAAYYRTSNQRAQQSSDNTSGLAQHPDVQQSAGRWAAPWEESDRQPVVDDLATRTSRQRDQSFSDLNSGLAQHPDVMAFAERPKNLKQGYTVDEESGLARHPDVMTFAERPKNLKAGYTVGGEPGLAQHPDVMAFAERPKNLKTAGEESGLAQHSEVMTFAERPKNLKAGYTVGEESSRAPYPPTQRSTGTKQMDPYDSDDDEVDAVRNSNSTLTPSNVPKLYRISADTGTLYDARGRRVSARPAGFAREDDPFAASDTDTARVGIAETTSGDEAHNYRSPLESSASPPDSRSYPSAGTSSDTHSSNDGRSSRYHSASSSPSATAYEASAYHSQYGRPPPLPLAGADEQTIDSWGGKTLHPKHPLTPRRKPSHAPPVPPRSALRAAPPPSTSPTLSAQAAAAAPAAATVESPASPASSSSPYDLEGAYLQGAGESASSFKSMQFSPRPKKRQGTYFAESPIKGQF
ncbi:hypothetical protein LTR50_003018 [Elasticomyces elasticus]|nr:hypothetical protein LTR50_003018 [Elasticomyces elasticus]